MIVHHVCVDAFFHRVYSPQNAQQIDGSNFCLMCCAYSMLIPFYLFWVPHYMKRDRLRQKYGLREDPCNDCCTTLCCSPCALCQEARFLKRAGIVEKNRSCLFLSLDFFIAGQPAVVIGAVAPGVFSNYQSTT